MAHIDTPQPQDVLTVALRYAALGLRVIPIAPGRKHPPVPEWQNAATTDPAIIEAWWTGLYRDHGIGIATGPGSGVWVLDVDTAGAKAGAASLADLEDSYGLLPATVEAVTGSGGRHLFFAWDPAHPVRNNQSGKAGLDLDVRGDGGQVVAAPTLHPTTGRPYRFLPGHGFGEIAPAAAPGWLYGVLERDVDPPAAPTPPPAPRLSGGHDDGDSPAEAFNVSTTWEQLLTRDGWTLAGTRGTEQRWVRPGKSARDGISATVGHGGRDVLKVFTSSVPELEADGAYSRFGYEAAVRYGNDRSACASALRREMNQAAGIGQHDDLSWAVPAPFAMPGNDPGQAAEVDDPTTAGEPVWRDPTPLEPELTHGPPFPVDALPAWMGDMARELAEALLVPVDLPAIAILGALSTVAMTKVKVTVAGTSWQEDSNLYLMCGFPSGGGKSPAFSAAMAPVNAFEAQRMAEAQPAIEEAQTRIAILSKREKETAESAARGSKTITDVLQVQAEARMVVVPPAQQFIVDDATPEAVAETVVECGGRAAQLSAEGTIVDLMGGQYAEKGKGANIGVWLQCWGGEPLRQRRVGRGWITHPSGTLTMCVMPQPGLVRRLGENAELGERGITARFLYSMPPANFGGRDYHSLLRPAGQDVRDAYEARLLEIANRCARSAAPTLLRTSPEATLRWIAWMNETEARLRPGADLEGMAGWIAKLRGSTLRIAALLHVAEGRGQGDEITPADLERAFVLADYFIAHYIAMHEVWTAGAQPAVQKARAVVEWVVREGITEFSASDLQRKLRRIFDVIGDTVEALTWLVEAGWLRAESGIPVRVGQPGKPSPRFTVHPRAEALANGAKVETAVGGNGATPVDEGGNLRAIRAFAQTPSSDSAGSLAPSLLSPFSDLSIYLHQYEDPSNTNTGLREGANGANLGITPEAPSSTPEASSSPPQGVAETEAGDLAPIDPDDLAPPVEADDPDDEFGDGWSLT